MKSEVNFWNWLLVLKRSESIFDLRSVLNPWRESRRLDTFHDGGSIWRYGLSSSADQCEVIAIEVEIEWS